MLAKKTKVNPQDYKRNSYLCNQTQSLQRNSIITDNNKNIKVDHYSMDSILMSDILQL